MVPVIQVPQMQGWFAERVRGLERQYTKELLAYVVGVLCAFGSPGARDDMSRVSVVLAYQDASLRGDFVEFQRIGDWVLWADTVMPDSFAAERPVVESLGQLSYLSCHRILRGQWHLYAELADELPSLAANVRQRLV